MTKDRKGVVKDFVAVTGELPSGKTFSDSTGQITVLAASGGEVTAATGSCNQSRLGLSSQSAIRIGQELLDAGTVVNGGREYDASPIRKQCAANTVKERL